ncbi:MAG: 50S ribosomal protein L18Ae, partial [Sulfolobales archaeon]
RGLALFANDKYPEWRKFEIEVRALKPQHAEEIAYSLLGSRHKIKRKNIKILDIKEISLNEVRNKFIRELSEAEGFEIVR